MQLNQTFPWRTGAALAAGLCLEIAVVSSAAQDQQLEAQAISQAVDDELTTDDAVPAWNIDVATSDGVVTLTGTVDNILAKDRAEKIAATVKGVQAVLNRIEVKAPYRADQEIAEDVQEALLWDPATETWEIRSKVDDGIVTLEGVVDSWQEQALAARVAKGVKGVKGIENQIQVDYEEDRTDEAIEADVNGALRWDAYIDHTLIDVAVKDDVVTLTGTVGSLAEKHRAHNRALVAGVDAVDHSGLKVEWWAQDPRQRQEKYSAVNDETVKEAIQEAFYQSPRVHGYKIDIEVEGGYVTLRGTVDNVRTKRAAGQAARGIVGVYAVNNRIKVRPGTPSDRTIENNVEDALLRDPYVERYDIDVSVVDGTVFLYGSVDSMFEKAQADDVASRQVGVREVSNFLTVNDPGVTPYDPYTDEWYWYDDDWYNGDGGVTTKTDWEITENIRDELFWSPFVDSDDINVEVDNGVALLTGIVETWSEREAAAENAFEGGAVSVDNDLMVEYGPEYYNP